MSTTSKRKRVIINADDFGFSPGVTEGILRAHREGLVTSTTLAANMPAAEEAVKRLGDVPELGVGVHLNVSQGPVLSREGAALAGPDGLMRWTALGLLRACVLRPRLLAAIRAECESQVRWVLDHGIRPTHLDSHRHVHAFSPIFVRVAEVAGRYDIPFVRWPRERLPGGGWPPAERAQRRVRLWLNLFAVLNGPAGRRLRGTDGTWGIAHTGRIDAAWLIHAARGMRPGVLEIMTHPGLPDDLDRRDTRLLDSRQTEMHALSDPVVRRTFQEEGIELIHYGHLRGGFAAEQERVDRRE